MNYSLFNTVVMFDHNSPPNLVPRAWTRLLHYLRAMLTNAVWKRFSRWTWGTLPSAAFSRILNASQVKVTWPSQKSTEYFESRAHSTRNASILKSFWNAPNIKRFFNWWRLKSYTSLHWRKNWTQSIELCSIEFGCRIQSNGFSSVRFDWLSIISYPTSASGIIVKYIVRKFDWLCRANCRVRIRNLYSEIICSSNKS